MGRIFAASLPGGFNRDNRRLSNEQAEGENDNEEARRGGGASNRLELILKPVCTRAEGLEMQKGLTVTSS